jgi:hypothetical protein
VFSSQSVKHSLKGIADGDLKQSGVTVTERLRGEIPSLQTSKKEEQDSRRTGKTKTVTQEVK